MAWLTAAAVPPLSSAPVANGQRTCETVDVAAAWLPLIGSTG